LKKKALNFDENYYKFLFTDIGIIDFDFVSQLKIKYKTFCY